jgi:hypothetical protein
MEAKTSGMEYGIECGIIENNMGDTWELQE